MLHSSNNIKFGGLSGTHTCKNKTLVFNCEDRFHSFVLLFKMIFSSQTQKELRATFRPYSAEVTANNNTLDVFHYKTTTLVCHNHSHVPHGFINIASS